MWSSVQRTTTTKNPQTHKKLWVSAGWPIKHLQFFISCPIFLRACDSETVKPGPHEGGPFTQQVHAEQGTVKGGGSSERSACSAHCLDFHLKACRPGRAETGIAAAHDRAPKCSAESVHPARVTHLGLSCPGTLWLFLETQPVGAPGSLDGLTHTSPSVCHTKHSNQNYWQERL